MFKNTRKHTHKTYSKNSRRLELCQLYLKLDILNILGRRNPLKSRSKATESKVEEPAKEVVSSETSAKPKSKFARRFFVCIRINRFQSHCIYINRTFCSQTKT